MKVIVILNRRWNYDGAAARVPGDRDGDCDPPTTPGKTIRIRRSLRGERRLAIAIHEMLHAAGWHIAEEFVEQFAEDAARALWRDGYRRPREER